MRNPWKLTSFALATVLAASLGHGAMTQTAGADPQPRMHDALGSLKSALTALQAANDDKGGHRVKAIAATKTAIEQTEAGIKFDNRH